MVVRPLRRAGSGRIALPEVREASEGSSGGPGVVVRPFRRSGSGRKTFTVVREWS